MRLIDGDALYNHFCPREECLDCEPGRMGCDFCGGLSFVDIREEINSQPTVEATGEWVNDGPRFKHGADWMHCSSCFWADLWMEGTRTPYCPICGAKMSNPSEAMKDRIATVRVMPAGK